MLLVARSWFSLREGITPVPTLVARAAALGYTAVLLADKGALYGAPAFIRACRSAGITPILGCTLPVDGEGVIFAATGPDGYRTLCRLVTAARTGAAPIAREPLHGLVALVSRPAQLIRLQGVCTGYLMVGPGEPDTGVPSLAVVTDDLPPDQATITAAFARAPQALRSTAELEALCTDPWPAAAPRYPVFPGDIRALAREGLAARFGSDAPYDRLERELTLICDRGLAGYFLTIWDLVRFAKAQSIPVGPGRGSAVGSLTAYALGVTDVDPLRYNLYFERFLNPERPDLPDIDIDVCSRGRPRLLRYIRDRHGSDRVACAGILTTLGPRGAVREAGRQLGTPQAIIDRVVRAMPHWGRIEEAVAKQPAFLTIDTEGEPVRSLLSTARELEGRPWHPSVHAAGVIVAPGALADLVPLEQAAGGDIITQYAAEDLDELGLVKIDILGLRNLTIVAETAKSAGIDPEALPPNDPQTFSLLARGESLGVFQLDSPGIRNLLRQVRPENLDDLIAVLSLYRPGPFEAGVVETFTRRRRGRERVRYLHPALAPILQDTYGVILYQEQAMRIAHEVAGLSLGEADKLRRALSKGDSTTYRERFLQGAVLRGLPLPLATQVYGLLERFCGYSFNKAHSAAYGRICYQTAYLKVHFPAAFFAALLANEMGYFGPEVYAREAQRLGVRLLPPHVNQSDATYAVESSSVIRSGLLQIKGIGPETVRAILTARERAPFTSIGDFCDRVAGRFPMRKALDALEAAGALSGLAGRPDGVRVRTGAQRCHGQLTLFDLGLESLPPYAARAGNLTSV